MKLGQKVKHYFFEDLWLINHNTLSFIKKPFVGILKICFLVIHGFTTKRCTLQASALTYITMMAMVPMIAVMFSVAKGFGAGEKLNQIVAEKITSMPENVQEVIQKILGYVENTNFGVLGAIGLFLIFYTALAMLGKIESSFNQIWGIRKARTFFRKFSDYISVLLIVPILLLVATSLAATVNSNAFFLMLSTKVPFFAETYKYIASFTGVFMIWFVFAFIFYFMPNTRVRVGPALIGGIIGGSLWIGLQWAYIHLQIGLAKYNAIYGTFASIPIFLAWLYLCWVIVLFGCEISFACQNYKTYEGEGTALNANQATREALGISILMEAAKTFQHGKDLWGPADFAYQNKIPIRLVRDVVHQLVQAKMLYYVEEKGVVLGRAPDQLYVKAIFQALRGIPDTKLTRKPEEFPYVEDASLKTLIERSMVP